MRNTCHPSKVYERRIRDMLLVNGSIEKIAQKLEIGEDTIRKRYKHVLDEFDIQTGPKPHEPTQEVRNKVRLLIIAGTPIEIIAKVIGTAVGTLYKYYSQEMECALAEANMRVAGNLYRWATSKGESKAAVTAAIHISRTRMGWAERSIIENTGPNGTPLENRVVVVLPSNGRDAPIIPVLPAYESTAAEPDKPLAQIELEPEKAETE